MSPLRIVSTSAQPFRDRKEAGKLLGRELAALRGRKAVVLGIPRGGIVVARELAREIEADLDIVLARKLRTPGHAELAMGSVGEDGKVFLNDQVVDQLGIGRSYIENEKNIQLAEIARRRDLVRAVRPKVPLNGRLVIVTDDGIATGATMQAALWAARQEKPARLVAAVPLASEERLVRLAEDADEMICLRAPPFFSAVGQFYLRFDQLEDEDVLDMLREANNGKVPK